MACTWRAHARVHMHACLGNGQPWPRALARIEGQPKHVAPPRCLHLGALQQRGLHAALAQQEAHKGGCGALPFHPRAAYAVASVEASRARVDTEQQPDATRADASSAIVTPHRLFGTRRRSDDRPTDLAWAYSRQAVIGHAASHDVVVATRCRTRLLDLELPVTHVTSRRAVHERLPQLRPVRDKWLHAHSAPTNVDVDSFRRARGAGQRKCWMFGYHPLSRPPGGPAPRVAEIAVLDRSTHGRSQLRDLGGLVASGARRSRSRLSCESRDRAQIS